MNVIKKLRRGASLAGIIMMMHLILPHDVGATDTGFIPFERSLKGLEEFFYVKEAVKDQPHKAVTARITSSQAIKAVKSASPSPGFAYTERVQEFLDFYTSPEMRKGVEIMLGLSETYMTLFRESLKSENLPEDLMYLPMSLSSLNTKTVSEWGASGLWQIMFTNGKLYNLQIDSYVDERRDPVKSTKAAILYLKDLYAIYLDWELAIAAYSSGPASINKAIRKAGGSKKYTDLYPYLPVETRDYLPAFTACYILAGHHELSGMKPYDIKVPNFVLKEPVNRRMHLGQVAEVLGMPLPLLQDMNPEYKSSIIPAESKALWIKLPVDKIENFRLLADSIAVFKDTLFFPVKRHYVVAEPVAVQAENVPKNGNGQNGGAATSPRNRTKLTYTVKDGDNLGYISGWYNVSVSEIRQWNDMKGDVIRVGQVLDIWVPDTRVAHYKGIDEMTFEEKQKNAAIVTSPPKGTTSVKPASPSASGSGGYTWYTVKSGDNPTTIASRYKGVTASEILKLNKISDPRSLRPGQKIKIPKK